MKRFVIFAIATLAIFCGSFAHAATVHASSGATARVADAAYSKLQCVVNYVENHGVKIVAMRGFGHGTVGTSQHPAGTALDINQKKRNQFCDRHGCNPKIPVSVSNGAADHCGVISGASWHNADNGHWNLESRTYSARSYRRHRGYSYRVARAHRHPTFQVYAMPMAMPVY